MNFSRLIKAMAVVGLVSFGARALANPVVVGSLQDFEGYDVGLFEPQAAAAWTVQAEDLSEIASELVSDFDGNGAIIPGDGILSQVLVLNTEGNDLTYAAQTTAFYDVHVDTMLKVVGSDSAPTIDAEDAVQTAVYLNTDTGKLNAYVTDTVGATNAWVELNGVPVADGDWIKLKILIDYKTGEGSQTATVKYYVNGVEMADAEDETVFVTANKATSFGKLSISEVSFRGTGMVDNFSVSEEQRISQYIQLIKRSVDPDQNVITTSGAVARQVDNNDSYSSDVLVVEGANSQFVLDTIKVYTSEMVEVADVVVLGDIIEGYQAFTIPVITTPTFTAGDTYYVQANYKLVQYAVNVVYSGLGAYAPANEVIDVDYNGTFEIDIAALGADDGQLTIYVEPEEDTYGVGDLVDGVFYLANITKAQTVTITGNFVDPNPPSGDPSGVDFDTTVDGDANLEFTSVSLAGDIITAEFTADGSVTQNEVTLYVKYSATMGGATDYVQASGAVTSDQTGISGTLTIDVESLNLDSFFLLGIATSLPVE